MFRIRLAIHFTKWSSWPDNTDNTLSDNLHSHDRNYNLAGLCWGLLQPKQRIMVVETKQNKTHKKHFHRNGLD